MLKAVLRLSVVYKFASPLNGNHSRIAQLNNVCVHTAMREIHLLVAITFLLMLLDFPFDRQCPFVFSGFHLFHMSFQLVALFVDRKSTRLNSSHVAISYA